MKKRTISLLSVLMIASASVAVSQDLDNVSIEDQFDMGERGNAAGTGGSFGASQLDGSEFDAYNDTDSGAETINYINAYAGASGGDAGNGESPVVDVTGVGNPDRSLLTTTIAANNRPGASDGSTVVLISDDGGQNTLTFGQSDNADYFIEVDVFCYDVAPGGGSQWAMVAIRSCVDEADLPDTDFNDGAYAVDREPSYALVYEYGAAEASAVIIPENYGGFANSGVPTPVNTVVETITPGTWNTFRVEANDSNVEFSVNGTVVASIVDTDIAAGRAALAYRELGVLSAEEMAGTFDNLKAGPATISSVADWSMY